MKNEKNNEIIITEDFFDTLNKLQRKFNEKNCKQADEENVIDIVFKHSLKPRKLTYSKKKYMPFLGDFQDIIKITTRTVSTDYNMLREYKVEEYGTNLILTKEEKNFEI